MTDTAKIELTAHRTSAGKIALAATDGRLEVRKYTTGGYRFYAVRVRLTDRSWDAKTKTIVFAPSLVITVLKRSKNRDVAEREARLRGDFLLEVDGPDVNVRPVSTYGARL